MFKQRVQGFAIGAATIAAIMVGLPMLSAPTPAPELDEFADSLGIQIVWTKHHPCEIYGNIGCFTQTTPNVVYVEPDLGEDVTRYVLLHEVAHVLQFRLGEPLKECKADHIAALLGAPPRGCLHPES